MIKVIMEKQRLTASGWETLYETESEITFGRFYKSFVEEKWGGEKRTDYMHTKYGYHHTKTTVEAPYFRNHERSVRTFVFPE